MSGATGIRSNASDSAGCPSRRTRQRAAIGALFAADGRPLTAPEVLHLAREQVPGIGVATVYRTLKLLVAQGRLVPVYLPGAQAAYEAAQRPHHHHFHCRVCGRAWDLPGCHVSRRIEVPARFEAEGHELVVRGRCGDCRGSRRSSESAAAGRTRSRKTKARAAA